MYQPLDWQSGPVWCVAQAKYGRDKQRAVLVFICDHILDSILQINVIRYVFLLYILFLGIHLSKIEAKVGNSPYMY